MPIIGSIFQKKAVFALSHTHSTFHRLPFFLFCVNLKSRKGAIFMSYINGKIIKELRENKNLTQKQLGEIISVSDKTVSKWETEKGLPDITLLEPLSAAIGVSVAELLSGENIINQNRSGNIRKTKFYVCPVCGNIITAMGEGAFSCCGINLPVLSAEKAEEGSFEVERPENDIFIRLDHPMTKENYVSFAAYITYDGIQIKKLYPEQEPEVRFPFCGKGKVLFFCNREGLFEIIV